MARVYDEAMLRGYPVGVVWSCPDSTIVIGCGGVVSEITEALEIMQKEIDVPATSK